MSESFDQQQSHHDLIYDILVEKNAVKSSGTLTKSKFLNGLQCPKLLWTCCNSSETIPSPSVRTQQVFDVGHQVGALAVERFPGGRHVQEDDFLKNIEETQLLLALKDPQPIYEAGIKAGRLYSRADILVPSKTVSGAWDIVEVKCGAGVKEIYLQDIAFQRYCYEQAGVKIGRCFLMHINNEYVRCGSIDVEKFFHLVDVTGDIVSLSAALPEIIDGFLKIIDLPKCPEVCIGQFCDTPYSCQMKSLCWEFLKPGNVMELRGRKETAFKFLEQGIEQIRDITDPEKLSDGPMIQYQCALSGKPFVDHEKIAGFVSGLKYPLYFMDFETLFEAIPRFDGTRPYQQVPFQFSVHLLTGPGVFAEHFEFLHKESTDPRPALFKALRECLDSKGTILAYVMSFEKARIRELGEAFPEHAGWCANVSARIDDLIIPFRSFFYYHPAQQGSSSLKKVLPALVGRGYEGMMIADGAQATSEYARVTYGKGVDPVDHAKVYEDLEAYCGLDTMAMVYILEKLKLLQKGSSL